jgi:uncharacterized protein YbaP (TraB family)
MTMKERLGASLLRLRQQRRKKTQHKTHCFPRSQEISDKYMTSAQETIKSVGIQYDAFTRENIWILAND